MRLLSSKSTLTFNVYSILKNTQCLHLEGFFCNKSPFVHTNWYKNQVTLLYASHLIIRSEQYSSITSNYVTIFFHPMFRSRCFHFKNLFRRRTEQIRRHWRDRILHRGHGIYSGQLCLVYRFR